MPLMPRAGISAIPVLGSVTWRVGSSEQIQFVLDHASAQTTEQYLGCKQRLNNAVNDRLGIEPED
jgi:hypothetical protein